MPITINGTGTVTGISAGGLPSGTVTSDTLASSAVYLTAPAGAVCFVAQNTAPTGWLKANGAAVSRTTYAALFAALGTTFGVGDGSTTFNLPDLRGEFPRGWDDSRGADSGRGFGSFQDGTYTRQLMNDYTDSDSSSASVNFNVGQAYSQADAVSTGIPSGGVNGSGSAFGGAYNDNASQANHTNNVGFPGAWIRYRPRNIALLAIIKF